MLDTWTFLFKSKKKIFKKNKKMICGNYCSQSVNYFNGVNENDQIE